VATCAAMSGTKHNHTLAQAPPTLNMVRAGRLHSVDVEDVAYLLKISMDVEDVVAEFLCVRDGKVNRFKGIRLGVARGKITELLNSLNYAPPSEAELLFSSLVTNRPSVWYLEYFDENERRILMASDLRRQTQARWDKGFEERGKMLEMFLHLFGFLPAEVTKGEGLYLFSK